MKSIEECLDMILNELVSNWDKPDNKRDELDAHGLLKKFGLSENMQKHEFFKRLIFRLKNEGYAEFKDDVNIRPSDDLAAFKSHTLITIEGYYFITKENGGYEKELEAKASFNTIQENRNSSALFFQRWIFVATGLMAIYYLIEMLKYFHVLPSSLPPCR